MEVIYGLIPGMLLLGLAAVGVLFWAARSGQFDDLEGDARRILMDEDAVDPRRIPDAEPDDVPDPPVSALEPGTSKDHETAQRSVKDSAGP
jgi:cbb3-type cytochrome oxidase maturation protein